MKVSVENGNLKIEKIATDKNSAVVGSKVISYKTDESSSFEPVGGGTDGTMEKKFTFAKPDKLIFERTLKQTRTVNPFREVYFKDIWTLSKDGKTLTIEATAESSMTGNNTNTPSYSSTKIIYEKQ
jgi:hypothetical protein